MKNSPRSRRRIPKFWRATGPKRAKPSRRIAEWSRAGKAAEARNAFSEALESYQQALALLNLLPESPERDLRELELRQSVVRMLWVTRGYAAPETIDATERAAALAEKSGNLAQLVNLMIVRGVSTLDLGRHTRRRRAGRPGARACPSRRRPHLLSGVAHHLQILTRYSRGDLAGVEKHFTAGLKFFDDPGLQTVPGSHRVSVWVRKLERMDAWPSRRCPRADGPDDGSRKSGQPVRRGALGY